jgi:hypothetical protein
VQEKAFKTRAARHYFDIAVGAHPERPEAPYALHSTIDQGRVARDASLAGVSVLVAGGPAAQWDDASRLPEWQGQYKVEHGFRLTNQLCLCGPVLLKNAQRIVRLILLIMGGGLVAGLLERQMRRALAERHEPIYGLMPAGRATLKPTVTRILRAFADDRLVLIKGGEGRLVQREFARPHAVQQPILAVLDLPHPKGVFGEPFQALNSRGG